LLFYCFFKFEENLLEFKRGTPGTPEEEKEEILTAMPFELRWHVQPLGRQAATWQQDELEKEAKTPGKAYLDSGQHPEQRKSKGWGPVTTHNSTLSEAAAVAFNPRTLEAEASRSLSSRPPRTTNQVSSHPGLYSETLSQNKQIHTHTHTHTHTHRERERERQRQRQRHRGRERERQRQRDGQRQTEIETEGIQFIHSFHSTLSLM